MAPKASRHLEVLVSKDIHRLVRVTAFDRLILSEIAVIDGSTQQPRSVTVVMDLA